MLPGRTRSISPPVTGGDINFRYEIICSHTTAIFRVIQQATASIERISVYYCDYQHLDY